MRDDDLRVALEAFIRAQEPDAAGVEVRNLARLWGGSSTETWRFDASWSAAGTPVRKPLILRRAPRSEVVLTTRATEFHLLKSLAGARMSSPPAVWLDEQGGALGGRAAMVLVRLPGRADRNVLGPKNPLALSDAERLRLAESIADQLAALHALDLDKLDLPAGACANRGDPAVELAELEAQIAHQEIEPALELRVAAWWLRDHMPPAPARTALVHGDFRPANMLFQHGEISGLLDWELAHVGDPLEDVGWYLSPNYRHEHFIAGAWTPEHFIRRYEQKAGVSVDRAALRFWTVFAAFKLSCIALATTTAFRRGDLARVAVYPEPLLGALIHALRDEADA